MSFTLTKTRKSILEAMEKGFAVTGRLADPDGLSKAEASMKKGRIKVTLNPRDTDALYNAGLIERRYEGLGNWTAELPPKGGCL